MTSIFFLQQEGPLQASNSNITKKSWDHYFRNLYTIISDSEEHLYDKVDYFMMRFITSDVSRDTENNNTCTRTYTYTYVYELYKPHMIIYTTMQANII